MNLLEFPHSLICKGDNFLAAYVSIPEKWMGRFLHYITELQSKPEVDLLYGVFLALKSWGRYNIPIPKDIFIDEFGVRFPYSQIAN